MVTRFFLITTLFLGTSAICQAQEDSAAKASQIIKIEQRLADALPGDSAMWNKYLDPYWFVTEEDGSGQFKAAFLADFKPFSKGISGNIKVTHPVFIFHENFAVIHYVADEHETVYGQLLHTTYGTVDTWYKTDTSWIMLSMLSFEIPAWPPAIAVDPHFLNSYTGTYQLTEGHLAVISLSHDTLYISKNKSKPEALFAETDNIFFRKSDARGRKLFTKNASGQMLMLERRNGQDLVWEKIPNIK